MVEFSSKAWHIRIIRWVEPDYQPRDLCRHIGRLCSLPFFFTLLAAVLVVVAPYSYLEDKLARRTRRNPGLVSSWVSARKRRVCPLITVIEDE